MYYDMHISTEFPASGIEYIDKTEYEGICRAGGWINTKKKLLRRIELRYGEDVPDAVAGEILAVRLEDGRNLKNLLGLSLDLIAFDFGAYLYFFDTEDIERAIRGNVYLEITFRQCLYSRKARTLWMGNVRRLLEVTGGRNVVLSTGAECPTELREPMDLVKALHVFGVSEAQGKLMLQNSRELAIRSQQRPHVR
jgi:hypothetical protein